ncbi:MAG: DNA topoisomerase I, partial [Anaerolineae bacterium]|nr:DNA topoisomerase I [Anaerolineae bacterium]
MGATEAHANLPKPEVVAKPARKAKSSTKAKTSKTKARKTAAKRTTRRAASSADKKPLPRKIGKLVIVESPSKARSVGQFLGSEYTVKASKGHIRDLLKSQLA